MMILTEAHIFVPTLLLVLASVLDLKYGKFPNWLFIVSFVASAAWLGWRSDAGEFMMGLGSAGLVFVLLIPLVLFKVLGAGDIKLMTSFCLLTSFHSTVMVLFYSLFWGLLIGLLRIALSGELKGFAQSFVLRIPQVKHHKVPYTFALLLGWFSLLTLGGLS